MTDRPRRSLGRPKEVAPASTPPEPGSPHTGAPGAPGDLMVRVLELEAELEALREAIRMERLVSEHGGTNRGLCALVRPSRQGGVLIAVADSQGTSSLEEHLLARLVEAARQVDHDHERDRLFELRDRMRAERGPHEECVWGWADTLTKVLAGGRAK